LVLFDMIENTLTASGSRLRDGSIADLSKDGASSLNRGSAAAQTFEKMALAALAFSDASISSAARLFATPPSNAAIAPLISIKPLCSCFLSA
jgi:hypothetical protein